MAKGDLVVGLDIGTTKICTVIAECGEGRVEILGIGLAASTGLRRGVVVDIDQTVRAVEESVQKAQRMAGAEVHSVIVGVTGEHIASLNSRGVIAITHADREVTDEDVERVLDNSRVIVLPPDRDILHAIPRGYTLDGQSGIRSPVGMSGTRLEVETHIVTGATTFLQNVAKGVERAGLAVEETVLEPIATGESVVMAAEKELGVALVDIGGGTSDLAIFCNGEICYSAVVPIGGNYVTKDVSAGLRTTLEEAERIKVAYGAAVVDLVPEAETFTFTRLGGEAPTTLPARVLGEIIEPRMSELFHLVRQEINRSNFAGLLPAGMVLSGGGSLLRGARDLAATTTGLPTRVGFPAGVGGLSESVAGPSFATAVGLIQFAGKAYAGTARRERPGGYFAAVMGFLRSVFRPVRP